MLLGVNISTDFKSIKKLPHATKPVFRAPWLFHFFAPQQCRHLWQRLSDKSLQVHFALHHVTLTSQQKKRVFWRQVKDTLQQPISTAVGVTGRRSLPKRLHERKTVTVMWSGCVTLRGSCYTAAWQVREVTIGVRQRSAWRHTIASSNYTAHIRRRVANWHFPLPDKSELAFFEVDRLWKLIGG